MTRAQRRTRARTMQAASAGLPSNYRPAGHLAENPNRGKRHAARLDDAMLDMAARIEIERRRPNYSGADRVPTTYRTLVNRDRIGRKLPAARVSETAGYTL
jgi:hypothetical protein